MFHCSICGRALSEKEALVHQGKDGQKEIICPACFEKEVGIDYETFRYRRENAKQTFSPRWTIFRAALSGWNSL